MATTIVVVPTFNEAKNLNNLVDKLLALPMEPGNHIEVLVVDDNSPDGTGQMADELTKRTGGKVHALHRAGKQGLGTAYVQGFRKALDMGADIIVQMDADFSHDPRFIPDMLTALKEVDVVIGSRYTKGGRLDEKWGVGRRLLSWWANSVWIRNILHTPLKDNTAGFRAWKRATLVGMDLNRIHSNGYIFQVEVTYVALRLGYKFAEVPIYFADRKYGESKMGLGVQIESAIGVFQVRQRFHNLTPADRASGS